MHVAVQFILERLNKEQPKMRKIWFHQFNPHNPFVSKTPKSFELQLICVYISGYSAGYRISTYLAICLSVCRSVCRFECLKRVFCMWFGQSVCCWFTEKNQFIRVIFLWIRLHRSHLLLRAACDDYFIKTWFYCQNFLMHVLFNLTLNSDGKLQ